MFIIICLFIVRFCVRVMMLVFVVLYIGFNGLMFRFVKIMMRNNLKFLVFFLRNDINLLLFFFFGDIIYLIFILKVYFIRIRCGF